MALTDLAIRHARLPGKAYRLFDCHGFYIQVNPSGSKLWYLKFRFGNKKNRMALGLIRSFLLHWQGRSKRI